MSPNPSQNSPWPAQTPVPPVVPAPHQRSVKRRRIRDVVPTAGTSLATRQIITDWPEIEDAKRDCQIRSGNDIFSCFPTADTVIPQHQWAAFVWNSNVPQITQTNRVNIYLFQGDSLTQLLEFKNVINPQGEAGVITAHVNDTWWGDRGKDWNGKNISYPFYWVITRADVKLDGRERPQALFHAVQTTYADSVAASMTAASSSASARSVTAATASNTSSVQNGSTSSGFPHWAIAVIVVLGFLAIALFCVLAFLIIRKVRRRNDMDSNRNSMGSASPMMANIGQSPGSPLLATHVPDRHSSVGHHAPSIVSPDGASTISRVGSLGEGGPFSGADAAIMADAFRKALRKPDFADRPVEEGESPEQNDQGGQKEELLNRELAEEGRDLRSVSSSKGFKVESVSSSGDTAHGHN